MGHLDQSKLSATSSFFPSTLSFPHRNQFHATYFSFSFHISCIVLASTIRFSRLLKKHLLINSLATAASPAHSSHSLCLWQGCGVWLHIIQVKAPERLSNGATTRTLTLLVSLVIKFFSGSMKRYFCSKNKKVWLTTDG